LFEPQRDEIMRGWRRLHNEELHNLYSSADIVRVIKLRRTCSMYGEAHKNILFEHLTGRDHFRNLA
jgi:hypothetical protein